MPGERWLLAVIVLLGILAGVVVSGIPSRRSDAPLELRVETTTSTSTSTTTTTQPPTTTSTTRPRRR